MASIDNPDPGSSQSSKDGLSTGELRDADTSANTSAEPPVPDLPLIKSPVSSPSATTDVSTAPSHQSPAPGSSSSYTAFANPPPKKFSAVNINKKFLQKTSTNSSVPSASLSNPSTIKTGSSAPRPSTQPSASHSRLVTAKLTSTAPLPAATGPSWSRPSSATPSASSTTPTLSNAHPSQQAVSGSAAPQLPHIGKVVQPQPHSPGSTAPSTKKDGSSAKPAWGTSKPTSALSFTDNASDFPTAAEVAQGLNAKSEDGKSEVSFLSKQSGEADAFRGVHLDPNAHHWDEMEEDDDNFLDNVIEFGDGRQYKVVPTEPEKAPSDQTVQQTGSEASAEVADHTSSEVVAKEDRFADDFDRKWPRSKFSPTVIQRDFSSRSSRQASISPASSQPSHSPLESPRVLFNERSNRLEPYSNVYPPTRFSGSHGVPKRDGRAEPFNRDLPPHSPASPVQLLQKSVESSTSTRLPRNYSRDIPCSGRYPDRDFGPLPASHYGQSRTRGRDAILPPGPGPNSARITDDVGRRRGSSGTHSGSQVNNTLLLHPPNPSDGPSPHYVQPQGSPIQPSSSILSGVPTIDGSIDSAKTGVASSEVPHQNVLPTLDVETMHKTTMHITAERARQRRQLEEEEREREKERARRKAAELEEQMKATETGRNQTQVSTTGEGIEETVGSLEATADSVPGPQMTSSGLRTTLTLNRTRSFHESKFPPLGASDEPTSPNLAESWRCKARVSSQRPSSPTRLPVPAPLPLLHAGDEPVTSNADENLEVVDFSDLGKLVGEDVPGPHQSSANQSRPRQRGRSAASEFFEDTPTSQGPSELPGREVVSLYTESSPTETTERSTSERQYGSIQGPSITSFDGLMSSGTSYSLTSLHRPHKNFTSFREPPIAALDDVMSRIKGALDNMQVDSAKEAVIDIADARPGLGSNKFTKLKPPGTTRSLPKEAKWLPPALRSHRSYHHHHDQEDFSVTGCDPPHSPRLAPRIVVKLPKVSHPVEPIQKRQLRLSTFPDYVRWDILSWNPPVDGMTKRGFSINDVLFKKFKGHRYQVTLPRSVRTGPRVHIPTMSSRVSPLYGRPKILDDLVSWRRGAPSDTKDQKSDKPTSSVRPPDVTSHSPRPSVAFPENLPEPIIVDDTSTKLEKQLIRPRNQPRLPPGSVIGFYRNPTLTNQQPNGTVHFTVVSELEDGKNSPQLEAISPSLAERSLSTVSTNPNTDSVTYEHNKDTGSLKTGLSDSKSPEDSTERSLLTPASASFGTPWSKSPLSFSTKDSPARAPDPEHLKAVWSQAADKEPAPVVNSLEGIADDLTSLPFTIQDVKSEDGETPPPTSSAGPSKMSLHDVTRAFQQVPASSSTSSHRAPPMSPQSVSGPITRPSNFSYPTPIQPSTLPVRPPYTAFPSTMLVHSPSPNLYPPAATSPIPRVPMNGPSQVYNQHVWVPMQSPQNPNGTMRPMASPYPTQMMAYPTTNTVHHVYGPSNQNPSTPVNGTVHARGVPIMSPVMHPAAPTNLPMYGGSPVMMHPPPIMPVNHRTPYMGAAPPVRGPVRSDVTSSSPLMQQPHPHPHQAVYGHVTTGFNTRPWC